MDKSLIQSINQSCYKFHMDEDRVLDHTTPMEDSDKEYDPSKYWAMLRNEIEWDQDIFLRHTMFEKTKIKS